MVLSSKAELSCNVPYVVSQSRAAESLQQSHVVCGWHHSHPSFPASPSRQDLLSQRSLQQALEWKVPFLGFITSQHWPTGRTASQYRYLVPFYSIRTNNMNVIGSSFFYLKNIYAEKSCCRIVSNI